MKKFSMFCMVLIMVMSLFNGVFAESIKYNFAGINLVDVVYSPELALYVAVGNDTATGATQKGRIFTSKNAIDWALVYSGTTIYPENSANTAPNVLVWNDVSDEFVAICGDGDNVLTSKDGTNWGKKQISSSFSPIKTDGTTSGNQNADNVKSIVWDGSRYLLSQVNGTATQHFFMMSYSTGFPLSYNKTRLITLAAATAVTPPLAISDGGDNVIVLSANSANKSSNFTGEDSGSWMSSNVAFTAGVQLPDAVYSSSLEKFIVAYSPKTTTTPTAGYMLLNKDGTFTSSETKHMINGTVSDKSQSIALGAGKVVFGTRLGKLYINNESDMADPTKFTEVTGSNSGLINAVTYGGGKFVAVASDAVVGSGGSKIISFDSDDTTFTSATQYENKFFAAEKKPVAYNNDTKTLTGSADIICNYNEKAAKALLILAVYNDNGSLENVAISENENPFSINTETIELRATITVDSQPKANNVKLFVWSGLDGLHPLEEIAN